MKANKFLLIFRTKDKGAVPASPEQLLTQNDQWNSWLTKLAVSDLLASQIKRWDPNGRVLKGGKDVVEGPYSAGNDFIKNVITILAVDMDEAREIAGECPILEIGGSVEIRLAV